MLRYYSDSVHGLREPNEGDSGFDLPCLTPTTLFHGEQSIVRTGIYLEIGFGYVGLIRDRSSMAMRRIYTHAGVIDSSYRGEISVIMENSSNANYHIEAGDRIAQILIVPVLCGRVSRVVSPKDLRDSPRGSKSFGSTGK